MELHFTTYLVEKISKKLEELKYRKDSEGNVAYDDVVTYFTSLIEDLNTTSEL
jgi:hypothetical protein